MRTQDATSGAGARGEYADLQQYDQKLKPSPKVPRKSLKKEGSMNEAFIRGFFDELEKRGALGSLVSAGAKAVSKPGLLKGLGQKAIGQGKEMLKDPYTQMQLGQAAIGKIQDWRQGRQQNRAAQSGQLGVEAKKKTGLMGGLGLGGAV